MKKIITFLLLSICIQSSVIAQDLFKVTEKDQDGNWHDADGKVKKDYVNNRIADINSILLIDFETEAILSSASNTEGLPKDIAYKISSIKQALISQKEILNEIDAIVKNLDYSKNSTDPELIKSQLEKLQPLAQKVDDIKKIDSNIEDLADKLSNGETEKMYSSNYTAAAVLLKELEGKLDNFAKEEGISIKFGAWLITKSDKTPLHINGFDNITPREQYEVERWALTLKADQKQELIDLQNYAKANRDKGLDIINEIIDFQIKSMRQLAWVEYTKIADQITLEVNKLGADANVQGIVIKAKALSSEIITFKDQAIVRTSYYKNLTSVKEEDITIFLSKITDDITYFSSTLEKLKTDASALKTAALLLTPNIANTISSIITQFTDRIEAVKNLKNNTIKDIFEGRKLDAAALEYSDAVLKLSLASIKKSFEYDLANSGFREEGNRIAFKLTVYNKSSETPVKELVREIYLFKVLTHVISTVGIIFADPFTSTAIQTQFQMAPYYNLLLKGWLDKGQRRKSVSYNKIFDWGVGLHVSVPDFDKDDVPELGAGIVITALHDYVQSGIAYNIFTGDPYWFFGLRIPTPTFGNNTP